MHIGGLGAGKTEPDGTPVPGDLADAMGMLDYLVDLGVNAVELMPLSQFEGWATWGYGTSHYCAVEFSGGGRDEFKYFVRECHRGGIAVILDVVYNHYNPDGERAEWGYDSDDPERNIYYWYEGSPANYPEPPAGTSTTIPAAGRPVSANNASGSCSSPARWLRRWSSTSTDSAWTRPPRSTPTTHCMPTAARSTPPTRAARNSCAN